jgi:site-specific DNA recombinase
MTLVTGKSGKYCYYKCASRHNQGNHACTSGNLSMEKLDALVLEQLADKVFAPERLQEMMSQLRQRIKSSKNGQQVRINELNREVKKTEERQQRLLDAIETGTIELDETTQRRAQQIKASREALFIELAGVRRDTSLPSVEYLKASQVDTFGKVLRQKLLAKNSPLAKSYLNILVDEIVVQDKTATISGSYAALADTMQTIKMSDLNQVPSFIPDWCARRESNPRPLASETNTLSS